MSEKLGTCPFCGGLAKLSPNERFATCAQECYHKDPWGTFDLWVPLGTWNNRKVTLEDALSVPEIRDFMEAYLSDRPTDGKKWFTILNEKIKPIMAAMEKVQS